MGEHDAPRQPADPPAWEQDDRAQARDEGADAPAPPAPPVCPSCGRVCDRRPTYYGAYVLLEPDTRLPAHAVPVRQRWYVDPDGRAWNGGGAEPARGAYCLVPHRMACPALVLLENVPCDRTA
ncbi:DUF6083 domain-containing protein [Streptomyces sp. NPDC085481]|uniref:DUF6083 domain-containing protein n=1 Tax=Streptomyces sp. NPDC085481 TaxID=3365727 RepID=UPI0037D5C5A0